LQRTVAKENQREKFYLVVEHVVLNALTNELRLCRLIFIFGGSFAIVLRRLRSGYGALRKKPIQPLIDFAIGLSRTGNCGDADPPRWRSQFLLALRCAFR
jgi:hypothetical protein